MRSWKHPPGGDRDELTRADRCPAEQKRDWKGRGLGKTLLWPPPVWDTQLRRLLSETVAQRLLVPEHLLLRFPPSTSQGRTSLRSSVCVHFLGLSWPHSLPTFQAGNAAPFSRRSEAKTHGRRACVCSVYSGWARCSSGSCWGPMAGRLVAALLSPCFYRPVDPSHVCVHFLFPSSAGWSSSLKKESIQFPDIVLCTAYLRSVYFSICSPRLLGLPGNPLGPWRAEGGGTGLRADSSCLADHTP